MSDLRVREKDGHDDAYEAEEKLTALIERVHMDAIEEILTGIDLAHQEHANTQWRIDYLEDELQRERDLKAIAEGMSISLTMEVGQHQEEIQAEVTWQRDEVRKLRADVNGKSLVSLVVFLPRIRG